MPSAAEPTSLENWITNKDAGLKAIQFVAIQFPS